MRRNNSARTRSPIMFMTLRQRSFARLASWGAFSQNAHSCHPLPLQRTQPKPGPAAQFCIWVQDLQF